MKYTIENIKDRYNQDESLDFLFFWGHQTSKDGSTTKSCLNQWWISEFEEEGIIYNTAEKYMMAGKAKLFNDRETLAQIINERNPRKVKALGRKVSNYDDAKWNSHKYEIVRNANFLKFSQSNELKKFLLDSENSIIVEASPVDFIWGIGMAENNKDINDPNEWKGTNLLGFALMEVRDELKRL